MDLTIKIGGEAGFGLAFATDMLARVFLKLGYHIYSSKDYASQIRGGHNYHNLRVSDKDVAADRQQVDCLLAFDQETIKQHLHFISPKGIIIMDDNLKIDFGCNVGASAQLNSEVKVIMIPLKKMEDELKEKRIRNSILIGAFCKYFNIPFHILEESFKDIFKEKPQHIERNILAARKGYDIVTGQPIYPIEVNHDHHLNKKPDIFSGNQAIAKAAVRAGLLFHAQYPMTPVSEILHYLSLEAVKNPELVVLQPEDEIAVINFALGASFAGARSMVATSGGGFALMVESIGLAGMAEIPVVIILGQRAGPSTGMPTKNEQGDLNFALYSGSGDFSHVVIAPASIEECYIETMRAFYLAEKYQLPVIVLVDKQLTESFKSINIDEINQHLITSQTVDFNSTVSPNNTGQFNLSNLKEQRFGIKNEVVASELQNGLYPRYDGLEKYERTLPGTILGMHTCAGDEHDEIGEITEDPEIRIRMMKRRMNKLNLIVQELPSVSVYGNKDLQNSLLVVSWGSNNITIREAVDILQHEGKKISFLNIKYLKPFLVEEVKNILNQAEKLVLIESNYTSQLGGLISSKTCIEIKDTILRYDGKTFTVDEICAELRKRC